MLKISILCTLLIAVIAIILWQSNNYVGVVVGVLSGINAGLTGVIFWKELALKKRAQQISNAFQRYATIK